MSFFAKRGEESMVWEIELPEIKAALRELTCRVDEMREYL